MKYVRTKDGKLHFNLGETKNGIIIEYNYLADGLDLAVNYDAIEKQADTIEELCDEFVFHTLDGYEQHFLSRGHLEDVLSNKNINLQEYLSCREIYGAIWTEWGLKYVAKMNDKGELELL